MSDGFSPVIQSFFDYDTEAVLQKMIDNSSTNKMESIVLKEINHYHQCDAILLVPMESFIKSCNMWQCNVGELYLLNSQVCMKFLDEVGFKLYGKKKLDA